MVVPASIVDFVYSKSETEEKTAWPFTDIHCLYVWKLMLGI